MKIQKIVLLVLILLLSGCSVKMMSDIDINDKTINSSSDLTANDNTNVIEDKTIPLIEKHDSDKAIGRNVIQTDKSGHKETSTEKTSTEETSNVNSNIKEITAKVTNFVNKNDTGEVVDNDVIDSNIILSLSGDQYSNSQWSTNSIKENAIDESNNYEEKSVKIENNIYEWSPEFTDYEIITNVQKMLNELDYEISKPIGINDDETKTQLLQYQYELMTNVGYADYKVDMDESLYNHIRESFLTVLYEGQLDKREYSFNEKIDMEASKKENMMWVYLPTSDDCYDVTKWKMIEVDPKYNYWIYDGSFNSVYYLGDQLRIELAIVLAYCNEEVIDNIGTSMTINSGYRSVEEQQELFSRYWRDKGWGELYYQSMKTMILMIDEGRQYKGIENIDIGHEYKNLLDEPRIMINGVLKPIISRILLPGMSNHNDGRAIDIRITNSYDTIKEILLKYGFTEYSEEKWHFDY